MFEDLLGIRPVLGEDADADARRHRDLVVGQPNRRRQGLGDPLRHFRRGVGGGDLAQDDHELVAAEPGDGVAAGEIGDRQLGLPGHLIGRPHRVLQPLRHLPQQGVAGVVAEGVVDPLEVVDVEEEDRDLPLVAGGVRQRIVQDLAHEGAVGQAGEAVEIGEVADPFLGVAALAHVEAASHHLQRLPVAAAQKLHLVGDPAVLAVGAAEAVLVGDLAQLRQPAEVLGQAAGVAGVDPVEPEPAVVEEVLGREAELLADVGADEGGVEAVGLAAVDHDRGRGDELMQPRLHRPQPLLGQPLRGQRPGELLELARLQRLLAIDHLVRRRHPVGHRLRADVGVAGHEDDVDRGVDGADPLGGGDAVDPGRHADVEKDDRERLVAAERLLDGDDGILTLPAGHHLESHRLVAGVGRVLLAEQLGFEIVERLLAFARRRRLAEDVGVLVQDALLVVDDENAGCADCRAFRVDDPVGHLRRPPWPVSCLRG